MNTKSFFQAAVCALVLIISARAVAQQGTVITGTVSDEQGDPLPGAKVFIELTNLGAAADANGKYGFTVPAKVVRGQEVKLTARFIGYRSRTEKIILQPGDLTRNFALSEDVLDLDAIITTGVLDETPKTKMAFSAAVLSGEALKQAPAISPETALHGKVAGLKVVRGNGQPGEAASILLRGATSINATGRSQDPLYIMDGAIIDPSISASPLADIPADEIESMEVVKGAAGAAIYGARGANGVIRITTKRGKYLGLNQTRVVVRNEIGANSLAGKIKFNQHHGYKIAASSYVDANGVQVAPGDFIDRNGNWLDPRLPQQRRLDPYRDPAVVPHATNIVFYDKPYKYVATGARRDPITGRIILPTDAPVLLNELFDHIDRFFDPGTFLSNTISVSRNMETTNFLINFGNRTETGVVGGIDGLNRKNFRLNLDHQFRQSLSLGVSGLYAQTKRDLAHPFDPFFALTFMAPDADITARDESGQLFIRPDPTAFEDNPLYFVENNDRDDSRSRILGNLSLRWAYYRTSAAYRMAQEPWWFIPGFEEFKLRAAYGTAGSQPNFFAGRFFGRLRFRFVFI